MNDTLDITKFNTQELEALAFRLTEQRDNVQNNLNICRAELQKKRELEAVERQKPAKEPAKIKADKTN